MCPSHHILFYSETTVTSLKIKEFTDSRFLAVNQSFKKAWSVDSDFGRYQNICLKSCEKVATKLLSQLQWGDYYPRTFRRDFFGRLMSKNKRTVAHFQTFADQRSRSISHASISPPPKIQKIVAKLPSDEFISASLLWLLLWISIFLTIPIWAGTKPQTETRHLNLKMQREKMWNILSIKTDLSQ